MLGGEAEHGVGGKPSMGSGDAEHVASDQNALYPLPGKAFRGSQKTPNLFLISSF